MIGRVPPFSIEVNVPPPPGSRLEFFADGKPIADVDLPALCAAGGGVLAEAWDSIRIWFPTKAPDAVLDAMWGHRVTVHIPGLPEARVVELTAHHVSDGGGHALACAVED